MRLRLARWTDARRLWRWANDPETRRASIHGSPIPWKTHQGWFADRLRHCSNACILIAEAPKPLAQVRFERSTPDTAVVSIVVAPEARGKGVATRALHLACPRAVRALGVRRLRAYVKPSNPASLALFHRAGFRRIRQEGRGARAVILLTRRFPSRS